jgi:DNA mismatch repair protein MutL
MPIKVLPPELATKIAAGEVVERPASVVKELVENSIDASATQITVEIKGGGVEELRVSDNGHGIPAAEVQLAFQRHATSKLKSLEQLHAVDSMGFRGEALPSIAAVSRLTMTTRTSESPTGHRMEWAYGKAVRAGPQGCPVGTSVFALDIFGNLPPRRKFLKSAATEAGRVQDVVTRYALVFPGIRFQLNIDGRQAVSTSGNGQPREALLAVYGAELADRMLEVCSDDPAAGYRVAGFIGPPSVNRANRSHMTFFVNRRWVQSRMLSYALEEAYHGLLPEKRHPIAAVNLEVPHGDVDVNFHPAKREVRFHQDRKVFSSVQRAARATLIAESPVPQLHGVETRAPVVDAAAAPSFFATSSLGTPSGDGPGSPRDGGAPGDSLRLTLPRLKVVGQVQLTYIVAEAPEGMYLVDQHAAHERVIFDQLLSRAAAQSPESQPLLDPVAVNLTPAQRELLSGNAESLEQYGFGLEDFGNNSYLLRTVPAVLSAQDPAQSLLTILDLAALEGVVRPGDERVAASIACHSAIRAGRSMAEAEMRALLEQLEAADHPQTCPHGRPTMIHFSSYHMEREFGRR